MFIPKIIGNIKIRSMSVFRLLSFFHFRFRKRNKTKKRRTHVTIDPQFGRNVPFFQSIQIQKDDIHSGSAFSLAPILDLSFAFLPPAFTKTSREVRKRKRSRIGQRKRHNPIPLFSFVRYAINYVRYSFFLFRPSFLPFSLHILCYYLNSIFLNRIKQMMHHHH